MRERDEERFERAVANYARAGIGGGAFVLPIVVLGAVGAAPAAMMGYLIAITLVLAVLVVWRRLHGSVRRR